MSHKPGIEIGPLQKVVLDADSFEFDVLRDLLCDKDLSRFIRGLKFSQKTINNDHKAQELFNICFNKYEIIADLQLAGGFDDMVERIRRVDKMYHPSAVTVAAGVTYDAVDFLRRYLDKHDDEQPDIFLTAILPEVSEEGCMGEFQRTPHEYTEMRAQWAAQMSLRGVYGAALHAYQAGRCEYLGSGISLDGQEYMSATKVRKMAIKTGGALALGCSGVVIGHAIANAAKPEEALEQIGEEIASYVNGSNHPDLKGV